ncbi:MAG: hypothetical protein KIS78_23880 [Labilithrix sp.]|nr:hypothetical protein [Labilithrix sp.]
MQFAKRERKQCLRIAVVVALLCGARAAGATTEIAALDGRYLGQAGTGIASSGGGAAMFHNPALLGATSSRGDFLFSPSLSYTQNSAPAAGPNQQQDTNAVSPAGFIAATYRIVPRLALGVAVQPTGGSGGKYEVNGAEISAAAFALEADVGAAFAITDRLSVGAMYRVGYLASTSKSPDATGGTAEASLSGADLFSFTVGAAYRFGDENNATKLGFYYRSRISAEISGKTETSAGKFDTTSHYALPEKFQLGISQALLDRRLLLAAQGGLVMYGWLPGSTTTTLETPAGPASVVTVSDDMTVWEGKVGGELWVVPETFAVRTGVWFGPEQVRNERVSLFNSMLGFAVKPTIGAGVQFGRVGVDLGAVFGLPHGETVTSTSNGNPGEYKQGLLVSVALGLNYRFGDAGPTSGSGSVPPRAPSEASSRQGPSRRAPSEAPSPQALYRIDRTPSVH